jgi:hypothetical protein
MKRLWRSTAGVMVLLILSCASASAVLTLRLTDQNNNVVVTVPDGGGLDVNPNVGVVTFVGAVGPTWFMNVTTGLSSSKPTSAYLDISTFDATSSGGGRLNIQLSDVGFGPMGAGSATAAIGGTIAPGATVSFATFLDPANGLFAEVTPLTAQGPFVKSPFSQNAFGFSPNGLLFSLTGDVTIFHPGAGLTSFDAELRVVPEPSTYIAGALLLMPFAASTLRLLRKR